MSFRYGRGALRPTHDYVCFSCHLQRHRITDSQHRRYQHVEASPTRSNADGVPLQIQSTNTQEGEGLKPKGKAASLETDSTTDGSSTPRKGGSKSKQDPPKQAIPKSKANKLEQDLQRQFAELRRKKLAKTGLPSGPATPKQDSNTVKSSVQRAKGDATVKAKSTVSGRKARTERRKLARAKKQTSSTSAAVVSPIENVSTKKGIDGTPSSEGNEKKGSKPVPKAMKKSKRKVPTNVTDLILETLKVRKYQSDKPNSNETLMDLKNQSSASERPEPEATVTANEALETTSTRSMKRKPSSEASPGSKASQAPRKTLTASTKRKPPSLKAPSGTTARKKADIKAVNAGDLVLKALDVVQPPVPNLSYGLERVLFNPGVYHLQDPRSRVYNFDPYLQKIMPVAEFDFEALKAYVTSSGDTTLNSIAQTQGKRYTGSSSSMTGVLAHFHFLLSQWREIHTKMMSHEFPVKDASKSFTLIQRAPSAVFLRWKDGAYAIDADKQFASANILMMLGKSMEKLLTLSKDDFERYRKSSPDEVPAEERNAPESYHYSTLGDFLMRSQLDAHDARLPGTGMFDLKTRAVVSVRMDAEHHEKGMDYEIKTRLGSWESYEREYFDMIRAAFLKYSLQVRMGRMDGIFVAFHNTQRIFGFQYISLAEMDAALHGQWDTSIGDQEFKLSLDLLNQVLDKATKKYPATSLRLHFETRDAQTNFMYIFAEPVTEEQANELQSYNDRKVEEFERNIIGLNKENAEMEESEGDADQWADMQANVEEEMDYDEASLTVPANSEEQSEQESIETSDDGPLGVSPSAEADGGDTKATLMEDHDAEDEEEDQEADKDEHELENAAEEDAEPITTEEDNSPGVEADRVEPQPEHDILATEDDETELVEGESPHPEASGDSQLGLSSAEEAKEVDDIDAANAASAVSAEAEPSPHTVTESASGELRVSGSDNPSDNEDFDTQADGTFLDTVASEIPAPPTSTQEVLAMTLTIRNKVNDRYVVRPEKLTPADSWTVEYALAEVEGPAKAWSLYQASQARRKKQLDKEDDDDDKTVEWYIRNLRELSKKGKEWRRLQDELDRKRPKVVLGQDMPEGRSGDGVEEAEGA